MYEGIAVIIIAILTPLVVWLRKQKNTATDLPTPPHRERWLERVRKFKGRIRP